MSTCRHLGPELDRREDGAHCPSCDALIYPASACAHLRPPTPQPASDTDPKPAEEASR
ncbi:hypothetical protein [Streptomyces marincola]|uniref:hypothetical protein n=1 Tax=Streptomyces marincola TaxID=2878388 RepID=UPI001CF20EF3|nr:hypothetical protein [Streptomyces marincola]UCM87519.1 hypothetical protein LC193_05915 [Streptomyces marincola]